MKRNPTWSPSICLLYVLEKYPHETIVEQGSSFSFALVKQEHEQYFRRREYDGLETPYLDRSRYKDHLMDAHWKTNNIMTKEQYQSIVDSVTHMKLYSIQ
ncbi:MAG: hypothetical protein EOP45_23240 [Sphingobacteriaceae bacterium]|nr:MAG: hypothetical protein EOP45_23240 [Sphingobacteriaceae bacterium]